MKATNKYITRVIACPECKGAGEILRDPGLHSKTYKREECQKCMGSGRLIRKTTIEYTPYDIYDKMMVKI